MTVTEKVAYLKGLAEGLGIEEDSKEGKLLKAVMDVLADLAVSVEDLEDYTAELTEQVDAIDEDLDALENDFYDDECDCYGDEDEEAYYDVCCPNCNEEFCVDEETLLEGGIECPGCGEHLEFGDIECDDECGCGCHDHDHTDE
mgnify:FL=1